MGQAFAKLLQRTFPVLRYPLKTSQFLIAHHILFCCHKIISQLNQNWKFSIHSEWELIKVLLSTGNKKRFSVSETRHCRFLPFTFLLDQGTHCCRRSRRGRPSRSRCWRARGWHRSCSCRRKALRSRWSRTFAFLPHFWEKYAEHILLIKVLENENLALAALLGNLKEQLSQVYKVDTITKSWNEIITNIFSYASSSTLHPRE